MQLFDRVKLNETRAVIGLLAIGLCLRLGLVMLAFGGEYDPYARLGGDTEKYLAIGISLSRGEGFSMHYREVLSEFFRGHPVEVPPAVPTAARSPGYPLFLALVFSTLGYHLRAVVVLQALLSTLTALFVYLIARELKAAPVLALTFAVFYYPFAFDAIYVMAECLLTFCTAALLWLLVRPRSELIAGVVAGVVVLVKSVTLPFLLLAGLIADRRGWIALAGFAFVVSPWAFRNYLHTGGLHITPSYGGEALFLLHNPWNRGLPSFDRPGDVNELYPGFQAAVRTAKGRAPRVADPVAQEYLEDRELYREALRFIRADPSQASRVVWRSFLNTWRVDYPTANWIRWLSNIALYAGLLPFVLWGALQAIRNGPAGARLLVLFLVYFVCVPSVFVSEIRYRVSAMPAYFVLAAYGISVVKRMRREGGPAVTEGASP